MKNKEYSKYLKLIIVGLATVASVLKWIGLLPGASISEIWTVAGAVYGISLGTMDFNISRDNWNETQRDAS